MQLSVAGELIFHSLLLPCYSDLRTAGAGPHKSVSYIQEHSHPTPNRSQAECINDDAIGYGSERQHLCMHGLGPSNEFFRN